MSFNSNNSPESIGKNESVPLSWEIGDNLDITREVTDLIESEKLTAVEVVKDLSLRAKIIDACGFSCTFCHNEGTPVAIDNPDGKIAIRGLSKSGRVSIFSQSNGVNFIPGLMKPDDINFKLALVSLRDNLGLRELHLTGGEPTLHPQLDKIVSVARSVGFDVGMTSNGERSSVYINKLAELGLRKINFSIFGTTPSELASVQGKSLQNLKLAARKIDSLHKAITSAADAGISAGANIVMSDYSQKSRIQRLLEEFDHRLDIRILPDLTNTHNSALSIYCLLAELKAKPVLTTLEAGSSNARVKYVLPNSRLITFKQIRPTKLDVCSDCRFNNPLDCKEGYYGVRLYVDQDNNYKVGVCLQRMDLTQSLNEFLSGDLSNQVVRLREFEYNNLRLKYTKAD